MSEESIFDSPDFTPEVLDTQEPQITIPTEVADLVGEGKKYKSVEEALRSVPHAQSHIQKLEEEMKAMKEELSRRRTAEELLDEFKSGTKQETTPAKLDQDTLATLVEKTMEQREAKKKAAENVQQVIKGFNEKFGEKGPEMYEKIAAENGLSIQFLNSVAATSPVAVLKLAGLTPSKEQSVGKTSSSVNTQAFATSQQPPVASAKLPKGANTKDLVNAWRAAGEKVKQNLG